MKRMYSKEELVSLIQQESSSVTVDSELSDSSENPVQNKVIKDALDDKQDSLPTVVNDKYLHTNADTGALEWSGADVKLYLHQMRLTNDYAFLFVLSKSSEAFTTQTLHDWLYEKGYRNFDGSFPYSSSYYKWVCPTNYVNTESKISAFIGVYSANESGSNITMVMRTLTLDISTGNFSGAFTKYESVSVGSDTVLEIV